MSPDRRNSCSSNGEMDVQSEDEEKSKSSAKITVKRQISRTTSRSYEPGIRFRGAAVIYTAGRPAWYTVSGENTKPFFIGISGGTASGKTMVAQRIVEQLNVPWVCLISMDSFYRPLSDDDLELAKQNKYNFDDPKAFDHDLILETLENLKLGRQVEVPIYNFTTHQREPQTETYYGANVVIFEGILAFHFPDIRLGRRLLRDIHERGRSVDGVLQQYEEFVKPAYHNFIAPTMSYADLIVPRGGDNLIAINLISNRVNNELQKRGIQMKHEIFNRLGSMKNLALPSQFYLIKQTRQVKSLQTIIRNRKTERDEFTFYSKRLMRILIEYALSLLPFEEIEVSTPQNGIYRGKKHRHANICGVSIIRAGECLEPALIEVCKDAKIGNILIQTNKKTGEPELHFLRLPRDISDCFVFLLDATIATGAAALMAIRVLLDHNVPQEKIALLSLLVSKQGVQTVAYVFPQVKIVSTACDDEIDLKTGFICPGLGNFGDRFFGTDEYQINESQESFSFEPCLNDSPSDKTSKVSFSLEF